MDDRNEVEDAEELADEELVELSADELEPVTSGAAPVVQDDATRALIALCRDELALATDPETTARLRYQLGLLLEQSGAVDEALLAYEAASEDAPGQAVYLRAARRLLLAQGRATDGAARLEQEIQLTAEPERRATLELLRGRLFEGRLNDVPSARSAYATALELSPAHFGTLSAAIRCARAERDWPSLADLYGRAADATADPALRAALCAERAAIYEVELGEPRRAAELYEAALEVDPDHPAVATALEQIYSSQRDWGALAKNRQRAAGRAADPQQRASWFYLCARVQREQLGDRNGAVASLREARSASPDSVLVLEELARLLRDLGEHRELAEVLRRLVDLTDDEDARCARFYSLGLALEGDEETVDEAISAYKSALALDPCYLPALQSLGTQLTRREAWLDLAAMHLAEAEASVDSARRASAHIRVAEIYETRLGDAAQAVSHYEQALALVPGDVASFKALVRLYSRARAYRKLIEAYERAIDATRSVEHQVAYLFKIGALWEDALEDPVHAAHAYRRVLKLRDGDLGALHALQRVSELAGQHQELVDYLLEEADVSTADDVVAGLEHRAAVVRDELLGDTEGATALLKQVLAIDATYVPALTSLGRIYHRTGRWNDLLDMYAQELEVTTEPRDRAALLTKMGELCEQKLGDAARAAEMYRGAVSDCASYRPASDALARVLEADAAHTELLDLLESQLRRTSSPSVRAQFLYRMAELRDLHLADEDGAIDLVRQALAEGARAHSPARTLLASLLARQERWKELASLLDEPSVEATVRRARLFRDRLGEVDSARKALQAAVAAGKPLGSLRALIELAGGDGDPAGAADASYDLATATTDPAVQAAALDDIQDAMRWQALDALPSRREILAHRARLCPTDPLTWEELAVEAMAAGDVDAAVDAHSHLAAAVAPADAADAWLRLAMWLEREGDPRANEFYARAVEEVPSLLVPLRGMARAAERAADVEGQAEALRREAGLRTDPAAAAELLVASARLLIDREQGRGRAIDDLTRALAFSPGSREAADLLIAALSSTGQHAVLIDVLSRAAEQTEDPAARANLWREVGNSHAASGSPGSAIAAFKRGLAAVPDHSAILAALVDLYTAQRQWSEAAQVLDQVAEAAENPAARTEALLRQADVWSRHLGNAERAHILVEDALALAPDRLDAFLLAAELRIELGLLDDASSAVDAVLAATEDPVVRDQALCLRADLCRRQGDGAAADAALVEGIRLFGTAGTCYERLRQAVKETGNVQPLCAALDEFVRADPAEGRTEAIVTLADLYATGMNLRGKAIELLQQASGPVPDPRLVAELATHLSAAGEHDGAAGHIEQLLRGHPGDPDLWRKLAELRQRAGDHAEAHAATQALAVLGVATRPGQSFLARDPLARPPQGVFGAGALRRIAGEAVDSPIAHVVAALQEAAGKLYSRDLRDRKLGRRDRLSAQPEHPLRQPVELASSMCGVELDVYVTAAGADVELGLVDPPSMVLGDGLLRQPRSAQLFAITRAMLLIAAELHPVLALSELELQGLLDAACAGTATPEGEGLQKALGRKWRKRLETALAELEPHSLQSVGSWRRAILAAANAAAAAACDDLPAASVVLRGGQDPSAVDDMLAYWASPGLKQLRAR